MSRQWQQSDEVGRLINLNPVGLKEAAIDSPTSRASVAHYTEQIDLLEKWLEDYMKATNRLIAESTTLESIVNSFVSHTLLPSTVTEAMVDNDYSMLAIKKFSEGSKDFWMGMIAVTKRLSPLVIEPIRQFLNNDIRSFREARRVLDTTQKNYDNLHAKSSALGKSKEPSSLREDAFQLHEARKAYLKSALDFASTAPQVRFSLDKLLVRIFFDQWREMRIARESTAANFQRNAADLERVKGWVQEMEMSEKSFRKELFGARRQLEDAAELSMRPSRELDDYSNSTGPKFTGHTHNASSITLQRSPPKKSVPISGEKQGWLYLRTYTGKPTRTAWVRRWAFLRNGVFGWLLQSSRAGGVEESERIGVLLCNARPAPAEERRFCFELKTNKNTIVLQAETQPELAAWIAAFEMAKSKALEDPGASDTVATAGQPHKDPAFSISPPPVPEFGVLILGSTEPGAAEDNAMTLDRTGSLPVPGSDLNRDGNMDLSRRSTAADEGGHRDHASRIISKLDLHKRTPATPQISPSPSTPTLAGGIASLIAASHGSMPVGPSIPVVQTMEPESYKPKIPFTLTSRDMAPSTLAPATLAAAPAPTNLSRSAVIVTGERGLSAAHDKGGIPNSLMANMWGSSSTAFMNRLERPDSKLVPDTRLGTQPSPILLPSSSQLKDVTSDKTSEPSVPSAMSQIDLSLPRSDIRGRTPSPSRKHRSTISLDQEATRQLRNDLATLEFPDHYPIQLKTQDAQFRLLFPTAQRNDRLVLVFRASWNPNDQQDFPGRIYVTSKDIYFYSSHLGLVLTSTLSLSSVDEVTAAPGRECDFLFLHMKENIADRSSSRITIKTFLEPLRLLQRRLNFLISNSIAVEPLKLEEIIKSLLKMEHDAPERSPSLESWEDVAPDTPVDTWAPRHRARASTVGSEFRSPTRVDRALNIGSIDPGERIAKFKLPPQPVKYTPPGKLRLTFEREYDVSPKALFHVMFGDKSALWQLLQRERRARNLKQGPWVNLGESRLRREFEFEVSTTNIFGQESTTKIQDYQFVDVNSDHLCYVVTDKRTPWHLPYQNSHRLLSKIVITHVAKGKCKLAVFVKVEWSRDAWVFKDMIERQALADLELDSQDLADLVTDQVRKLGPHSRTKKAVQIFGQVGQSTESSQLEIDTSAHNIVTRRSPIERGMTGMVLQSTSSAALAAAGVALESLINFVNWLAKTFSANKFILIILVMSALFNTWHSSRDTYAWWQERNATKFLGRLGISRNTIMSKSVYVSDLDEVLSSRGELPNRDSSLCFSVFQDEHKLHDLDAPAIQPSTSSSNADKYSSGAQRVQKTRQRLGMYRHDLLVAVRVVNSIEKELLQSQWEDWIVNENRRCRQAEKLVTSGSGLGESALISTKGNGTESGEQDMMTWFHNYCASCQDEHQTFKRA